MGPARHGAAHFLAWLWREERSVARVLIIAVGILLVCAPVFAAAEIAVLSSVQLVQARHPAVIRLGAGTYDISQDIGDVGFPDAPTAISVTGPGRRVLVRWVPQVLSADDAAKVFLGEWDCYRVMSLTIPQAGSYQVSIKDRQGMSGAWISEPYTEVAGQVFSWALGTVAALLTITVCLIISCVRWR